MRCVLELHQVQIRNDRSCSQPGESGKGPIEIPP